MPGSVSAFTAITCSVCDESLIFRDIETPSDFQETNSTVSEKSVGWEKDGFHSQKLSGKLPCFVWLNPGLGMYNFIQSRKKLLFGILGETI